MLDMGFIQPIRDIAKAVRSDRQTLLFSATMPKTIERLAQSLLTNPVRIEVKPERQTTALIEQSVYMVHRADKQNFMARLLNDPSVERAVIFTRTKHGADKLTKRLSMDGTTATAIHGNKPQRQRQRALESFRSGNSRVLVATDVAARGLDVDGITHVFNFDIPNEAETYVHRIGRTGRAGATGFAVSLCDREERGYLKAIERLTNNRIPLLDMASGPALPRAERTEHSERAEPVRQDEIREERPSRPHTEGRTERTEERPKRTRTGGSKGHRKGQANTPQGDAGSESQPKRKPRRGGGSGWGVEASKTSGPKPRTKSGVKKAPGKKRGAPRGAAKGPAGKPGSGVKRVRRSDVV